MLLYICQHIYRKIRTRSRWAAEAFAGRLRYGMGKQRKLMKWCYRTHSRHTAREKDAHSLVQAQNAKPKGSMLGNGRARG